MEDMRGTEIVLRIRRIQQQMKSTGRNTMTHTSQELEAACQALGVSYDPARAPASAADILDAVKQRQKCQHCTRVREQAAECVCVGIEYCDGTYVLTARQCPKGRAYLQQRRIDRLTYQSGVGRRFQNRTFETFRITPGTEAAYQACQSFCRRYQPHRRGLRIHGRYGCGKTHLAAAIVNTMTSKGVPAMFVVTPDLLQSIRRGYDNPDSARTAQAIVDSARTIDILVLDDLGSEKPSDWVREQLFVLINARYEAELPTIITSNYSTADLVDRLGQRIVSRLIEMTTAITMTAPDYRMQ